MVPQIAGGSATQIEIIPWKTNTPRFEEDYIFGYVDGLQAVRQAVFHILMTERYAYPAIYDDNYGIELEQYIGGDFEFLKATIGQTLSDALTQDDRILSVSVLSVTQDGDSAHVIFQVESAEGSTEMELDINV